MPNNKEWSTDWSGKITNSSGGSVVGETHDGEGKVTDSRFGEFAYTIGEMGELFGVFPEIGIICTYTDDMKLCFASIEIGAYFNSFPDEAILGMINGGEDVMGILESLAEEKKILVLTVFPLIHTIRVELRGEQGLDFVDDIKDADINNIFVGHIVSDGYTLAYTIQQKGDELEIAIGERSGTKGSLITTSVSNELDYMRVLESRDPKKHRKLAEMIVLNR